MTCSCLARVVLLGSAAVSSPPSADVQVQRNGRQLLNTCSLCCCAPVQVQWFPNGEQLVTSSADKSVRCWDAEAGVQIKRLTEHKSIVNSINPLQRGPQLFVSGGDDSQVKVCTQPPWCCLLSIEAAPCSGHL